MQGGVLFHLADEVAGKIIHPRAKPTDFPIQVIKEHDGGNGDQQARGRGNESLGYAGRHIAYAGGAFDAYGLERIHDAPDRTEQPYEWRRAPGSRQKVQISAQPLRLLAD